MRATLFTFLLALFPLPCFSWTNDDTQRQAVYLTAHFLDYGQTLHTAKNCDAFVEHNPVLGTCPTTQEVSMYFVSTALLHSVASYYLPKNYRIYFQLLTIQNQYGVIEQNHAFGLKLSF